MGRDYKSQSNIHAFAIINTPKFSTSLDGNVYLDNEGNKTYDDPRNSLSIDSFSFNIPDDELNDLSLEEIKDRMRKKGDFTDESVDGTLESGLSSLSGDRSAFILGGVSRNTETLIGDYEIALKQLKGFYDNLKVK